MSRIALGLALALSIGSAAQAGDLFVLRYGSDTSSYVQIDGGSYQLIDDVAEVNGVYAGYHTVVWNANGTQYSATFELSAANVIPAAGSTPETWCLELNGDRWSVPLADDCDEALFWMLY